MKSKIESKLTFFERFRSLSAWHQHLRIILSMTNTIFSQFGIALLPAYFAYFSLVYGVTAISDLMDFFVELAKKENGDRKKMIAAAESAAANIVWAVAYLFIVLFFVSNPMIAVTTFMAGTVYDLGFAIYKLHDAKNEADPVKKAALKKDAMVNIAVAAVFLIGCIALVGLAGFMVVNPVVMTVAASIIIAAVIGYRGWEFYKKRTKSKQQEVHIEPSSEINSTQKIPSPSISHSLKQEPLLSPEPPQQDDSSTSALVDTPVFPKNHSILFPIPPTPTTIILNIESPSRKNSNGSLQ